MTSPRTALNRAQLVAAMGWSPQRFDDAMALQLLPDPDVSRPQRLGLRWSPPAVRGLVKRRDELNTALDMGMLGASSLAGVMTERLSVDVDASTVAELSRLGYIPRSGKFKGYDLYAVWAAVRSTILPALEQAKVNGRLRNADGVAEALGVRRSDVDNLVRLGWLKPARMADNPYNGDTGAVPLYRHVDVAGLLMYAGIDWEAVRATPRGKRSPLVKLGRCGGAERAVLEQVPRGLIFHRLGHRHWAAGDRVAALDSWRTAAGHTDADDHLAEASAGGDIGILRCAAWMGLLPADPAGLS